MNGSHIHPPKPDEKIRATISKACKEMGKEKPYHTAGVVVAEVLKNNLNSRKLYNLQKIPTLSRTINREREKHRPKCPTNLDTPLLMEHIPDNFLRADIRFQGQRHLLFATDKQLKV